MGDKTILRDYKFLITLQDFTHIECNSISITDEGIIHTDNLDYPIIHVNHIGLITIKGEL